MVFQDDTLYPFMTVRRNISFPLRVRHVDADEVDRRVTAEARSLASLTNVEFIGERASDAMPAYAQAFDVEAVWFIVDDLTRGVTPLKVFESLAAGTPVVSTPLPACELIPGVRIAGESAAFTEALRASLNDATDSDWRTQAAATANDADWSRRLSPLLDRLDDSNQRVVP